MPKNSFNSIDARSLTGEAANTAIKILSKLDLLDDEGIISALPFGKAIQGTWKLANKIVDPHKAARHSVGVAVGTCFAAGLREFGIEQFELNESEEKRFKAAIELAKKKAQVDLKSFDVDHIEKTEVAQRFLEVYKQFYKKSDPLHYEKNLPRLEGFTEVWLTLFWRRLIERKPERFSELEKALDRESFQLEEKVLNDLAYQANLANMYLEPTQNDSNVRLSDLYIMPRCEILESLCKKEQLSNALGSRFCSCSSAEITNNLHELVSIWLRGELNTAKLIGENYRLLLLYGMPGQGKTSFCKRLMYDLLNRDERVERPVYFIRLRKIPNLGKLKASPLEYIIQVIEEQNQIEINSKNLGQSILILDGMDELAMSSQLTMSESDTIIQELLNESRNIDNINIVVTSRHGYVDADRPLSGALVLQISELTEGQQIDWIDRYRILKPSTSFTLNVFQKIDRSSALGKLITQPILLQMVADLDKIPSDTANRAELYQQLFDFVVSTPWKEKGQNIAALANLGQSKSKRLFRYSLQEMAFEMFRNEKDYLPSTIIEQDILSVRKLMKALGNIEARDSFKTMYISFYFREIGVIGSSGYRQEEEEYALEFVHKSFSEFLVAEYLYRRLDQIYLATDQDGDLRLTEKREALREWNFLVTQRPFSKEIVEYLIHMIYNDSDEVKKERLKDRLIHFSSVLFQNGFLLPEDVISYQSNPIERGVESFYIWFIVCSCLSFEPLLTQNSTYRQIFLRFLHFCLIQPRHVILVGCDLTGSNLKGGKMAGSNLASVKLLGASLEGADMRDAICTGANLKGAFLQGVNLERADLQGANLERALIHGANLSDADLRRVNLQGAQLQAANLESADLEEAYLLETNLQGANLIDADLQRAFLREANLRFASLERANLKGAHLDGAYMWLTDLFAADLRKTSLQWAHLQGANLEKADLREADLEQSFLQGCHLERCLLQKANFEGANLSNAFLDESNLEGGSLYNASLVGASLVSTNLEKVNLEGADLSRVKLEQAKGLSFEQLLKVSSLLNCTGLPENLYERLLDEKPCLFEGGGITK